MDQLFGKAATNFGLQLDFNPIIEAFGLKGFYILQHWQAKPFGLRHFGYLAVEDTKSHYRTLPSEKVIITAFPNTLQIDERFNKGRVPTAFLLYQDCFLELNDNNQLWHILPLSKLDTEIV